MDLGRNSISDGGAQAIADVLKTNNTLTTLNLGWNSISGEGAQAIARSFKKNSTLTNLNLRNISSISDEGAQAIVEALKPNKTLRKLVWYDDELELYYERRNEYDVSLEKANTGSN